MGSAFLLPAPPSRIRLQLKQLLNVPGISAQFRAEICTNCEVLSLDRAWVAAFDDLAFLAQIQRISNNWGMRTCTADAQLWLRARVKFGRPKKTSARE